MDTMEFRIRCLLSIIIFLTNVVRFVSTSTVYNDSPSLSSVMNYLQEQRYDRFVPPGKALGRDETTTVYVGVYINSISSINEIAMDVDLDIFLRMWWVDPRLSKMELTYAQLVDADDLVQFLWMPDLFFLNGKVASYHRITEWNMSLQFRNGSIFTSVRVTVKLHCPMRLDIFPMDRQSCDVYMESYAVRLQDLQFRWIDEAPIEVNANLQLPRFNITSAPQVFDCVQVYRTGNFSCLCMSIPLQREIGYYMIQVYIPSMLVVIISWLSFFLSPDAVAARTSLGVVTVLTVTTQNSNINQSIPKVSYVKAIDVWHATCLAFVFASLMEFALANSFRRRELRKKQNKERLRLAGPPGHRAQPNADTGKTDGADDGRVRQISELSYNRRHATGRQKNLLFMLRNMRAKTLDYASRIFFPLTFLLFNAIYWPYYLSSGIRDKTDVCGLTR